MRLIATIALLALALGHPALAETNVGVTAAVNQDAKAVVGSNIKTISLGDSVVFNQRIETGAGGLVQVLLADGTTFMVGPNSDLVIDSFVYDPNAGTAQVAATFTKGVLRFIGGQTSKTEGGVTINTPVGTMGIRGAMVDVVLNPPAGTPPHVDMLFGNEVTLEQGQQLLGRLYAAGYSLALGPDGKFEVLKTPPGWGSQIQAALAGKAGTKGGAPKGPNDDDVKNSDVADNNSGNGVNKNTGQPPLTQDEIDALLEAAALYDELRNFILNNQSPQGYIGGVFTGPVVCDDYSTCETTNAPGTNDFEVVVGEYPDPPVLSYTPTLAKFAFDANGNPLAIEAAFLASVNCDCGNYGEDVQIVYTGNGVDGGGKLTISFPGEDPYPVDTHNDFLLAYNDPSEDNPLNGVPDEDYPNETYADQLNCQTCNEFIKWGFWGFSADGVNVGDVQGNIDFMGAYISGDLTTKAQMSNLAALNEGNYSAHYSGDAVGVVYNAETGEGGSRYIATGNLEMDYNFGQRAGVVEINNFDAEHLNDNLGIDISYGVSGSADGTNGFVGFNAHGAAQGAFVNDGSSVAAGVIGNWTYAADTYNSYNYPGYSVSGVFMGDRPTN